MANPFVPVTGTKGRRRFLALVPLLAALWLAGCGQSKPDPHTAVMLIESSPANLDPRIGTDAQAEHIDMLLFDSLVRRDAHFGFGPGLATRWETPDPRTYIFHLRGGVRFADGRPLTARDVKWTIDSMRDGTVITVKTAAYASIDYIDTPDPETVVFHLKQPDNALLANLSDGAIGIVPYGSGRDFAQHPIGSGPFEFVSQALDRDVVIERSPDYWGPAPRIERVRFAVVPDATTRALELEKGSADVLVNGLPADTIAALRKNKHLVVEDGPGTELNYIVFNTRDPILHDVRVRQAIAMGINRPLIIRALFRGEARLAESLLPPEHWAWTATPPHRYDPAAAQKLLDAAGYPRGKDGIRFHLSMKTSTDETTRLTAMVIQEELGQIGIQVDLRSYEFATFYADLTHGAFQMAPSRWVGGNEQPDIFRYVYASSATPPHGANRGFYSNPTVDALLAEATQSSDRAVQQRDYAEIQQIVARELPSLNLWYLDTVVVHSTRLKDVQLSPSGTFDFLRSAELDR